MKKKLQIVRHRQDKILLLSQQETTIIISNSTPYQIENVKILFQIVLSQKETKQLKALQIVIQERSTKEDINIKEKIITDEFNYNTLMEFQTDIKRKIELDAALVTQTLDELVNSPMFTMLFWFKSISDKRMLCDSVILKKKKKKGLI